MFKKVLILQGTIPPYRVDFFNELNRYYDLTVLHTGNSPDKNYSFSEIKTKKSTHYSLVFTNEISKISFDLFDVVIVMSDIHWVNFMSLSFKYRKKVLFWGHGMGQNKLANYIKSFLIRKSKGIIAYNKSRVQKITEFGVPRNKVFIANNTQLISNHSFLDVKEGKKYFLFIGRIQERKKLYDLINAFHNIIDVLPIEITIKIVGRPYEELKKYSDSIGLDKRVFFLGAIYDEKELLNIYQNSIAYVSPGAVGLSVLQSFAYGIPVVTAQVSHHGPEFANIEHNINGIIYDGSIQSLSKLLLDLSLERQISKELGINAYNHYVNECQIQNMVLGFKNAIESI